MHAISRLDWYQMKINKIWTKY